MSIKKIIAVFMIVLLLPNIINATYTQSFDKDGSFAPFSVNGDDAVVQNGRLKMTFTGGKNVDTTFLYKNSIKFKHAFSCSVTYETSSTSHLSGYILFRDYSATGDQLKFFNTVTFKDGKIYFVDGKSTNIPSGKFHIQIVGNKKSLETFINGNSVNICSMPTNFGYEHSQELRLEHNSAGLTEGETADIYIDDIVFNSDYRQKAKEQTDFLSMQNFEDDSYKFFRISSTSTASVYSGALNFDFISNGESSYTNYIYKQDIGLLDNFCFGTKVSVDAPDNNFSHFSGTVLFRDYSAKSGGIDFYNMIKISGGKISFADGTSWQLPGKEFYLKAVITPASICTYIDGNLINSSPISKNFNRNHKQELRFELTDDGKTDGMVLLDDVVFYNSDEEIKDIITSDAEYYFDYGRTRIRSEKFLDPYDGMNIKIQAVNMTNSEKNSSLIDGKTHNFENTVLAPGKVYTLTLCEDSQEIEKYDSLPFYLWDGIDNMQPITQKQEIKNDGVVIPTISEFGKILQNTTNGNMFVPTDKVIKIQNYLNTESQTYDADFCSYFNKLKSHTDSLLKENLIRYTTNLDVQPANRIYERVSEYSLMYKITGETKYADRAIDEMINASGFPDWNDTGSFLVTAAILSGLGIGYDALYDYMTEEQRNTVASAIYKKGLLKGLDIYRTGVDTWDTRITNWNIICNAGMGIGAMAIGNVKKYNGDCAEAINTALRNMKIAFSEITPSGGWHEGIGYSSYMLLNSLDFFQMLDNTYGTIFGHENSKPIQNSAYFFIAMNGENDRYSYNDGESGDVLSNSHMFYLAHLAHDNAIGAYHLRQLAKAGVEYRDIMWYESIYKTTPISFPDTDYYDSELQIGVMRDNFEDNTYLAFNGDKNFTPHSQNDMGSFVYDSDGVRWFEDLGSDNYDLYEFLSYYTYKWYYYRNRAEGHNCMVFAPGKFDASNVYSAPDQVYDAECNVMDVDVNNAKLSSAKLDLTQAYSDCSSYFRTFVLDKASKAFILRDEISFPKSTETYWFAHTKADITLSSDKRSAVLTRNYNGETKKLYVTIAKGNGTFEVMDAKPLATSPDPDKLQYNIERGLKQNENKGIKKLAIHQDMPMGLSELVIAAIPEANKAQINEVLAKYNFN